MGPLAMVQTAAALVQTCCACSTRQPRVGEVFNEQGTMARSFFNLNVAERRASVNAAWLPSSHPRATAPFLHYLIRLVFGQGISNHWVTQTFASRKVPSGSRSTRHEIFCEQISICEGL